MSFMLLLQLALHYISPFEFGIFWHGVSLFLFERGDGSYIWIWHGLRTQLANSFFPKDCVVCLEVLFPIWTFTESQNLKIYSEVSQRSLLSLPWICLWLKCKNTELNRTKIKPLSFLLREKVCSALIPGYACITFEFIKTLALTF